MYDLLRRCRNRDAFLNVTALAYFKENQKYYSFRTLITKSDGVRVRDFREELSEEELAHEVKAFSFDDGVLWIDIIEWIDHKIEDL